MENVLHDPNKIYEPGSSVSKGDSDVFETLEITKTFKSLSEMTTLSTPMSSLSKTMAVRAVNESHTGFKCPFHTPSGPKLGLVNHMALTTCFSRSHYQHDVENFVIGVIGREPHFVRGEMALLINSMYFTTLRTEEVEIVRLSLKRHERFYDTAFIPNYYRTSDDTIKIISYNVMYDGGRLYRPLFVTKELLKLCQTRNIPENTPPAVRAVIEGGFTGTTSNLRDCLNSFLRERNMMIAKNAHKRCSANSFVSVLLRWYSRLNLVYTLARSVDVVASNSDCRFCEINPVAIYGINGACAPMFNHNPGGRAIHECAMANSALTIGSTNMPSLSETSSKLLLTSDHAAVTTIINEYYSRFYGNGIHVMMMIKMDEENIDDATVASEPFSRTVLTKRSNTIEVEVKQGIKVGIPSNVLAHNRSKYHAVNPETGLPVLNSELKVGDCIFAMYREDKVKDGDGEETSDNSEVELETVNLSEFIEMGKEGIVSKIKQYTIGNTLVYRITISSFRFLEKGDKLASRYSQKGVIGGIIKYHNLPYVISDTPNKGVRPDIIFSPMSLTSRATPGLINELHLGNYAIATGKQVDATAFTVNIERMNEVSRELLRLGYGNTDGSFLDTFYDPTTKRTFRAFMGVCYIRVLEHFSYNKLKACSQLTYFTNKTTRQAGKGGISGGLREGDMELHTMGAHSASSLIHQLYCNQSDRVVIALCKSCGHLNDRLGLLTTQTVDIEQIECCRCKQKELRATETSYGAVQIHFQLLTAGFRAAYFPK